MPSLTNLPVCLTLPFLEQRDYLHGTTLFDALQAFIPAEAKVFYTLSRRISSNKVKIIQLDPSDKYVSASLIASSSNTTCSLGVVALSMGSDLQRLPYKESLVTQHSRFMKKEVIFDAPWPFSFIATIVPLNKALLSQTVHPNSKGQWFFTRLEIEYVPQKEAPLKLKIDSMLGTKLVKTAICINNQQIGYIYFSWVANK